MNHITGLSHAEVQERQNRGLTNKSETKLTKSVSRIICENVFTFFNLFNLAIGACVALVGEFRNLLFLGVIFSNTLIGIVQEIRSKRMVDKLSLMTMPRARVLREGKETDIHFEELVLGDVIKLTSGCQIGADAEVLEGSVEVNEALLTGEADAIFKSAGGELLSGSFIVSGACCARVIRVGADNYATALAREAKTYKRFHSKLLDSLNGIIRFTSFFVLPLGLIMFFTSNSGAPGALNTAVLGAVAAMIGMLPNGLMLLTSVSLSVGVIKLGRARALVQQLFGIETLSRVDIICLDKTGTLTEGRMRVERVIELNPSALPVPLESAMGAFVCAMDDNNATFLAVKERFCNESAELVLSGRVPFSSERKYSAAVFKEFTLVMGAPDVLLKSVPGEITALERDARVVLIAKGDAGACPQGVFARGDDDAPCDSPGSAAGLIDAEAFPGNLTPVAALVLEDVIRPEAMQTLDYFASQGVQLKIISGDNPQTVSGVARRAGFADCDSFVDARELDTDEALAGAAEKHAIFGRVKPAQKRALIKALQSNGHTVAMVGDGVNDVLALREADCSVAMAAGSEAARQIAQIVLIDSNFALLPGVVNEGRRVVNNITRTASLFLMKTGYSFLLSLLAIAFALPYPFIPVQLTLIGIFIQAVPSFFLALEPNAERISGSFFGTVLGHFLPGSIAAVLNIAFIRLLAPYIPFSPGAISTLCVMMTGITGLFLLMRVSRPFNRMRAALFALMTAGFFLAAWVFPGPAFFSLAALSPSELLVLLGMTAVCYPLTSGIAWIIKKARAVFVRRTE